MMAYLLDELPEADAVRCEEEYLSNDDALAMLEAIESELYDAYAQNALSPERSRIFEAKFLKTLEQRNRLAFSRALLRQRRVEQLPSWHLFLRRPLIISAVAGVVVLILAVVFWKGQPALVNRETKLEQRAPVAPAEVIVSVSLDATTTRSAGDETVLSIVPAATVVRLHAAVDSKVLASVAPPFQAKLSTPEGREVWKNSASAPTVSEPGIIVVDVPPMVLSNGYYILSLSTVNAAGAVEEFAAYSFVARKS